jgi:hypothetical protein
MELKPEHTEAALPLSLVSPGLYSLLWCPEVAELLAWAVRSVREEVDGGGGGQSEVELEEEVAEVAVQMLQGARVPG